MGRQWPKNFACEGAVTVLAGTEPPFNLRFVRDAVVVIHRFVFHVVQEGAVHHTLSNSGRRWNAVKVAAKTT